MLLIKDSFLFLSSIVYKLKTLMCFHELGKNLNGENVLRISFKRNLYHLHFSNRLYHSPFRLYPIKRTDNAESASSPSNYIPRTQSHLNIAEFGGDKHGAHVPGSHSPSEEKFAAYQCYSRGKTTSVDLISR